jgi:hypothetical protein
VGGVVRLAKGLSVWVDGRESKGVLAGGPAIPYFLVVLGGVSCVAMVVVRGVVSDERCSPPVCCSWKL